jgi:foldase protein PrsA
MKYGKTLAALGLTVVMASTMLTGCGSSSKLDGTQVAGTVNGEEVTLGEISFATRYLQAVSYSYYYQLMGSTSLFDGVADEDTGETYGQQVVSNVVDTYDKLVVLKQHASDYNVELTDDETSEIDAAAQSYIDSNDQETLDKVGASKDDVVSYLTLMKYQEKMMAAMTTDVDTTVTEDESNQTSVRIIRLEIEDDSDEDALKTDMQSIYDALAATDDLVNADMLSIAQGINENATTVINSYTTSDPTDTSLDSNAVDAVKDKEAGQLSDGVFESSDGKYLMVAVNLGHDDDKTESKVKTIISERKQDAYDELLNGWVDEAEFVHNEDVTKQISVTDKVMYTQTTDEESSTEESTSEESSEESSDSTESTEESSAEESTEESSSSAE